jgi:large subunit ribosomal protein L13Ae
VKTISSFSRSKSKKMVFEKPIVVDCRGHLVGRLASLIAKELLQGQHVVAVRCEQLEISGSRT